MTIVISIANPTVHLCEICRNEMETGRTQLVCSGCTCRIFRSCIVCATPVVQNWTGDYTTTNFQWGVSIGQHVRHVIFRWAREDGTGGMAPVHGPFVSEANPVAAFGKEFLESLDVGRCTSSGNMVCTECGFACDDCGEIHDDEDSSNFCCDATRRCGTCSEWWDDEQEARRCCAERYVHDYSFRPPLRFHDANDWTHYATPGVLFMGVELEMENVRDHVAYWYSDAHGEDYGTPDFSFWKDDGSLGDDGAELVTMPATLDGIRATFPWDAIDVLHSKGARAFHTGTCGMHIHVSRSAFTPTHLWRFVKLQTKNVWMCEAIGQRPSCSWARWTSHGNVDDSGGSLPDYVKGKDHNHERYVAINFQNHATVELRYFRGNMVGKTLMARFEFVHAMWEYTRTLSVANVRDGALDATRFLEWTREHSAEYPKLVAFCDARGI